VHHSNFPSRFHLFQDHSEATRQYCVKLDQAGIFILMWGACVPMIYYGFMCNRYLQIFYWTTVSNEGLILKTTTDVLLD
jgi:adiponectin receptor